MLITENQHNSNWREAMFSSAYEWLDAARSYDFGRWCEERDKVAAYLKGAPSCGECGAVAALTHEEGGCSHD